MSAGVAATARRLAGRWVSDAARNTTSLSGELVGGRRGEADVKRLLRMRVKRAPLSSDVMDT